ncbi:hypothetical protein [Enterobacillus tribolii]|uniref:hypothetical protein n=1 Tax=Enterobacillus tribolii TaxID=1487935 RepID=UPI0011C0333B|nr:hypothetical protein [Enterobacillus tribolii]MBW7981915.1 hypothetical protein [Enterobacillus tribolii]
MNISESTDLISEKDTAGLRFIYYTSARLGRSGFYTTPNSPIILPGTPVKLIPSLKATTQKRHKKKIRLG